MPGFLQEQSFRRCVLRPRQSSTAFFKRVGIVSHKSPKIEYYAMKVVVFSTGGKDMNDYGEPQLLITYKELPKFCRTLQTEKRRPSGVLAFI